MTYQTERLVDDVDKLVRVAQATELRRVAYRIGETIPREERVAEVRLILRYLTERADELADTRAS